MNRKIFPLLAHSSTSAASAPESSDPAGRSSPGVTLTRRELRERERAARAPVEVAEARHGTHRDPVEVAAIETEPLEPAPVFMPIVQSRIDAFLPELDLPEPDTETIADTARLVAAPAASEAPVTDLEQLQTDVSPATMSTPVRFPARARAQARPRQAPTRSEQPALQPSASLPAAPRRTAAAPRSPQTAKPSGGLARRLATAGFTFAAMVAVALMAVSTSLPAEALLSSADVQAAARVARQPTSAEPAQTLTVTNGTDTISVQRDGYASQSLADFAAASGIRMEATFTNNPNGTIQWPFAVGVKIGDRFGPRDCAGCSSNHQGQDFNPGVNAPIQAIADGVVSYAANEDGSLGTHMIIDHVIDGKPVSSVYSHMVTGSMKFKVGDVVKVGQIVGKTGNTGQSTGPHLDLEIRIGGQNGTRVDPLAWLYANTN
jgi:murein DD-endopeptidase MepM/ murein hydrolase activator NlpD